MVTNFKLGFLRAPKELEPLVGLFGKPYISTFDCRAVYSPETISYRIGRVHVSESMDFAKCDSFFAEVFTYIHVETKLLMYD